MAVPNIQIDKQKYIKTTLDKLKNLSNYDISMLLEKISILTKNDEFPIYPIYERVKNEDGAFILLEKKFERKDGGTVANTIISKMIKFLHEEAVLLQTATSNILEVCDTLKMIESDGCQEDINTILKNFDSKFSFLVQVDVYCEVYNEFRRDYINLLIKSLRHYYSKLKLEEEEKIESSLFVDLPPNTYRRAIRKHRNNKPKRD